MGYSYSQRACKESDTTELLHFHIYMYLHSFLDSIPCLLVFQLGFSQWEALKEIEGVEEREVRVFIS